MLPVFIISSCIRFNIKIDIKICLDVRNYSGSNHVPADPVFEEVFAAAVAAALAVVTEETVVVSAELEGAFVVSVVVVVVQSSEVVLEMVVRDAFESL